MKKYTIFFHLISFHKLGIHSEIKAILIEREWIYSKPSKALSRLRDEKIKEEFLPTPQQLSNYIYRMKMKYLNKNFKDTVADLTSFQAENTYSPNLESEQMFVLYGEYTKSKFLLVLTSHGLLQNIMDQRSNLRFFILMPPTS